MGEARRLRRSPPSSGQTETTQRPGRLLPATPPGGCGGGPTDEGREPADGAGAASRSRGRRGTIAAGARARRRRRRHGRRPQSSRGRRTAPRTSSPSPPRIGDGTRRGPSRFHLPPPHLRRRPETTTTTTTTQVPRWTVRCRRMVSVAVVAVAVDRQCCSAPPPLVSGGRRASSSQRMPSPMGRRPGSLAIGAEANYE